MLRPPGLCKLLSEVQTSQWTHVMLSQGAKQPPGWGLQPTPECAFCLSGDWVTNLETGVWIVTFRAAHPSYWFIFPYWGHFLPVCLGYSGCWGQGAWALGVGLVPSVQGIDETQVCAGIYFRWSTDACEERDGTERHKSILPDLLLYFICKCMYYKERSQGLEMYSGWASREEKLESQD